MTPDATLAINASIVGGNPTGLGIYSIKLIRALDEIRNDFSSTRLPAAHSEPFEPG